MAVFQAFLKPGDTFMGMALDPGRTSVTRELSELLKASISIAYLTVSMKRFIDYDEVERIALECQPKLIVAGASAYCRTIDFKRFRELQIKVNAIPDG